MATPVLEHNRLIDIGLPSADGVEERDLGAMILSDRGDCNRLFADIQADAQGVDVVDWVMADLRGVW